MTPILPDRQCWASTIGNFIMNFGMLDWHVQNYLEDNLAPDEFAKFKGRHFRERVERINEHLRQGTFSSEKREEFGKWAARLEPIRELRNHIAHGVMRVALADDMKTGSVTLSLPRDLDETNPPEARHLSFAELFEASTELTNLIEDFQKWVGNWVVDAEIRF